MRNNFDAVRLGLALTVVFCHLAVLSEVAAFQPFLRFLSADFAVKGFFVISGCLVTRSYLRSQSGWDYAEKRVRRIYPAYAVTIGLGWLIGMVATRLSVANYINQPAAYKYLAANAAFLNFLQPTLPGVFEQHAVPALNASLWTIKVELCLYCCVPLLVGLFRRIGAYPTAILAFCVALLWEEALPHVPHITPRMVTELARQFPGVIHFFTLGAVFTMVEHKLGPKLGWIALVSCVAFFLLRHHRIGSLIEPLSYASSVLFAATGLPLQISAGRWGDLSYGTYLVHFPIIQLFIHLGVFQWNPWLGLAALLLIIVGAAFVLWHVVEKPLLKRNSHYVAAKIVNYEKGRF